jgi:hypothetical protein
VLQSAEESGYLSVFKDEMAIKITISKQMVACDKQKTALVIGLFQRDNPGVIKPLKLLQKTRWH